MLIRLIIDNIYSFGQRTEFTTIPNNRLKTLNIHRYNIDNFRILKLSSIYGANGAGKSNLIKSLYYFQKMVLSEEIPYRLKNTQFKFQDPKVKSQILAVEFFQDQTAYYYAIKLSGNTITTEELYLSGMGQKPDELIFERTTTQSGDTSVNFLNDFENDEKSQILKSILLEEFIKPNKPILKLLANRDNTFLKATKKAFQWFDETLQIILPSSKPAALAQKIDTDLEFREYAEDMMGSFNLGIQSLKAEKKNINEFFGEDNEHVIDELIKSVENTSKKMIGLRTDSGEEIIVVKENESYWVKELKIIHSAVCSSASFDMDEESDGTRRLLDFVPAFKSVISDEKVYLIDEIERSIHPLLMKELVRKFSLDSNTKGQLIFTTHESNLLDQDIFRQDEIWFVEKDQNGMTDLYSLSDFKEHKTIDIRKGYLTGRYGSIPFLGNLIDLNWHEYAFSE